ETDYGQDESFDKNLGGDNLEIENSNNENDNKKDTFEDEEHDLYSKNESETRSSVCDSEKKDVEEVQEPKSFELELELHIACAILNDSLYEPLKADKNKVAKALNLIQQDWFKLAAQKDSDPILVEEHLNAFYSRFSNLLLERIVNMADLNHNTALHYSVSTGNFEIVNLLLDSKVCDVNSQNKAGYTSIMLAAVVPIKDDFERLTLKRLFSEGNVNIKSTDSGQTALMLAVRHGNKDTVALLLESSADCNAQDKEGSTALMAACEHGHIDIVRLLLDNTNCDPDIKDNDGETAFEIAKNKNRNDIIVLLYAHSTKLRSHHPAIQFSKTRPRIGSAGPIKK
ncbi:KN motif and ankyrin repeat domain-containing 3, partial [Brachionus plicatilis]